MMGQDKKNEQKIKIIVNDGSATKVLIDTLLNGDTVPDSLLLKDGSVIRLRHPHGDGRQISVTYSSDNNDRDGVTREMTVISTDTLDNKDDDGNVMYFRNAKNGHHHTRVIKRSSELSDRDSDSKC
jgi:hypothetical protein